MKEFEPSKDFVSRVMRSVHAYEQTKILRLSLADKLVASRPFRYAMSTGSVLVGIFFIPANCI
jgi:hypothetical protein